MEAAESVHGRLARGRYNVFQDQAGQYHLRGEELALYAQVPQPGPMQAWELEQCQTTGHWYLTCEDNSLWVAAQFEQRIYHALSTDDQFVFNDATGQSTALRGWSGASTECVVPRSRGTESCWCTRFTTSKA